MSDEPCSVCGSPYHSADEMHPASSPSRDAWTYEYVDPDGAWRYEVRDDDGDLVAECWSEDVARRICGRTADDERADVVAYLIANSNMRHERIRRIMRLLAGNIERGDHVGGGTRLGDVHPGDTVPAAEQRCQHGRPGNGYTMCPHCLAPGVMVDITAISACAECMRLRNVDGFFGVDVTWKDCGRHGDSPRAPGTEAPPCLAKEVGAAARGKGAP
jgi:hypothetical protein